MRSFWQRCAYAPRTPFFNMPSALLQEHHFIREGFSNDFAHWALAACNQPGLAEQLASVDVREFTSLGELRERFIQIVEKHLQLKSARWHANGRRNVLFLRV